NFIAATVNRARIGHKTKKFANIFHPAAPTVPHPPNTEGLPMCGIVGAVSTRNIIPILVQGLQRLEYRGYDSCGVAVYADGLKRARSTDRVTKLLAQIEDEHPQGTT